MAKYYVEMQYFLLVWSVPIGESRIAMKFVIYYVKKSSLMFGKEFNMVVLFVVM